jgi:3'-phosphoadenosine 5'-phosphosulfate (PAPS) 3'-phosphatase
LKPCGRKHDRVDFISAGSSLKICRVAEGGADVYPRLGPTMEWDTAAGQAIAVASGARVVRHDDGKPLAYNKGPAQSVVHCRKKKPLTSNALPFYM